MCFHFESLGQDEEGLIRHHKSIRNEYDNCCNICNLVAITDAATCLKLSTNQNFLNALIHSFFIYLFLYLCAKKSVMLLLLFFCWFFNFFTIFQTQTLTPLCYWFCKSLSAKSTQIWTWVFSRNQKWEIRDSACLHMSHPCWRAGPSCGTQDALHCPMQQTPEPSFSCPRATTSQYY